VDTFRIALTEEPKIY